MSFARSCVPLFVVCLLTGSTLAEARGQARRSQTARDAANLAAAESRLRERLADKADPYLVHQLATVLYRQGKVFAGRKLWDQAANDEPNLAGADVSIALELLGQNNIVAAELALQSAEKRNPRDPHLFLARGDLALRQRDFETAHKRIRQAVRLDPKLTTSHIWMGKYFQLRGDLSSAEPFYRTATQLSPNRPEGWAVLAELQFRQDRIPESLESLRRLAKTDGDRQIAEAHLGKLYLRIGDLLGALRWFELAVERQPDEVQPRLMLAQAEFRLHMNSEARRDFGAVLKKEENLIALLALAQLESGEGQIEQAAGLYRRALKVDPRNVVAANNSVMHAIMLNRPADETLKLAERAVRLASDNPSVQGAYGCALVEAGRFAQAKTVLARAVRQAPASSWIRYAYGKVHHHEKRFEEAHHHLQGCLILDPEFFRKKEVLDLLKTIETNAD